MKKTMAVRKLFVVLLCALIGLSACDDYRKIDEFTGKWQLQEIRSSEGVSRVDTIFYNFQSMSLFNYQIMRSTGKPYTSANGYRKVEGNRLLLELEGANKAIDWPDGKKEYIVNKINRKEMILMSDDETYYFNKY